MAKIEIDLLDTSLDNSADDEHILGMVDEGSFGNGDHEKCQKFMNSEGEDVAYNYYRDPSGNTVTYRLVHVGSDEGGGGSTGAPSQYSGSSGASNGASSPAIIANSVNGQLYVIGSPEVFGGTTNKVIPRENQSRGTTIVKRRDDRRRATHNEVERRRRDKINNWILKLAKMIPPSPDQVDKGSIEGQSKGGILAKACEYITELKDSEHRLEEVIKDNERLSSELMNLSMQVSTLKRNNMALLNQLNQHGISFKLEPSESGS